MTGLTGVFFLAINELTGTIAITVVAALGGCATGFGVLLESVQRQWPVTAHYIDMQRVRERLDEIEG